MFGIGIYIHWTFLILLAYIAWANSASGPRGALLAVVFILAVFLCVVLHELGHALMARRFGVGTRDITLLPIGGVARLERIPEEPRQELLIAIAGPAVNVVIAAILYAGLALTSRPTPMTVEGGATLATVINAVGLAPLLMVFNIWLVLFNLIPAFPMDGGRMLRALLASRLNYARATRIAAGVGQVIAILFAFWGLLYSPFLVLIAVFIFLGAQAEANLAEVRYGLSGVPVRDAMLTTFTTLSPSDTLAVASEHLLHGSQQDFPVVDGGQIVGVLPRADLVRALAEEGPGVPVGKVMRGDCAPVQENERLYSVFQRMQETKCPLVPVTRQGELVGLVTLENVGELMMINSAMRQARGGRPTPAPDPVTGPGSLNRPRSA
jgi:Zn-dependent protease